MRDVGATMDNQMLESNKGNVGVSMSSSDEATHQDQVDMARLGKDQQFKVCAITLITWWNNCPTMYR